MTYAMNWDYDDLLAEVNVNIPQDRLFTLESITLGPL